MNEQMILKAILKGWTIMNMCSVAMVLFLTVLWFPKTGWGTTAFQLGSWIDASNEYITLIKMKDYLLFSVIYQAGAIFSYSIIKTEEGWE